MNIKIYTAIIGGKDNQRSDVAVFSEYSKLKDPVMNAKIYKVLPQLFFEADYSIWIDGNLTLLVSPESLINMLNGKDIGVFAHPSRNCLYDEAERCVMAGKDDVDKIKEQINRYRIAGFGKNQGLGACFLIVRKHTNEIAKLNERWWAEICRGSNRDQLSFPFVFGDRVQYFSAQEDIKTNEYFMRVEHNK